jgi:hypothetical protein
LGDLKLLGARRPIVEEPLAWAEEYPIQWREPEFNLAELAKLRWIKGLSTKQLAEKYGRTECAIENYYQKLSRLEFRITGLTESEKEGIWGSKNSFRGH